MQSDDLNRPNLAHESSEITILHGAPRLLSTASLHGHWFYQLFPHPHNHCKSYALCLNMLHMLIYTYTHAHTHTHIYIYIYAKCLPSEWTPYSLLKTHLKHAYHTALGVLRSNASNNATTNNVQRMHATHSCITLHARARIAYTHGIATQHNMHTHMQRIHTRMRALHERMHEIAPRHTTSHHMWLRQLSITYIAPRCMAFRYNAHIT